jgi:hypothetical protein
MRSRISGGRGTTSWLVREPLDAGLTCGTDPAHGSKPVSLSGLSSTLAFFSALLATFVPGTRQPPLVLSRKVGRDVTDRQQWWLRMRHLWMRPPGGNFRFRTYPYSHFPLHPNVELGGTKPDPNYVLKLFLRAHARNRDCGVPVRVIYIRSLNWALGRRNPTTMPTSAASRGSSILQLLTTTKKVLQDAIVDARYIWRSEMGHARGLKFEFAGRWSPQMKLRSNE